jgi:hypothetical protein
MRQWKGLQTFFFSTAFLCCATDEEGGKRTIPAAEISFGNIHAAGHGKEQKSLARALAIRDP